jgi:hypothetical protein
MPKLKGYRLVQLGLTAIPVLTLVIVHSLSLLRSPFVKLPPELNHLLASVFAYLHFVLWVILVNVIPWPRSSEPAESVRLMRSGAWLVVGLIVLVFCVAMLGPGIGSFEGDTRLL